MVKTVWLLGFVGLAACHGRLAAQEAVPSVPAAPQSATGGTVSADSNYKTPSDIFDEIAQSTRPLWRQQYRAKVETSVPNRQKAALGLGALVSDLHLATMARDTQQIRNLAQDQESLERLLGISDRMARHRQKILMAAESSDWPATSRAVSIALEKQLEQLQDNRDHDLAELVYFGQWLRTWQISTGVVVNRKLDKDLLCIGDTNLLSQVAQRVDTAAEKSPNDRCLKFLAKKTSALSRLWRNPSEEGRAERLRLTEEVLADIIGPLIQNESSPKPDSSSSPSPGASPSQP